MRPYIKRVKKKLATEMRVLHGSNASAVLQMINPIQRGWASYYRGVVSSKVFHSLDNHLWKLTYKWATYTHPNRPKYWIINQYFGQFNRSRQDRWVFGDRDSGAYLPKFAWTKIVRHQMVTGGASPDDPALAGYWANRRRRNKPPLDRTTLRLLRTQQGRCPQCGDLLLHADREPHSPEEWQQWHRATRKTITKQYIVSSGKTGTSDATRLVHAQCHHRHVDTSSRPSTLSPEPLSGLA